MLALSFDEQRETAVSRTTDGGRFNPHHHAAQANAPKRKGHDMEPLINDRDNQRPLDDGSIFLHGDTVFSRNGQSRGGGTFRHRLFRTAHQFFVFLAWKQYPFLIALQNDMKILERHEELSNNTGIYLCFRIGECTGRYEECQQAGRQEYSRNLTHSPVVHCSS